MFESVGRPIMGKGDTMHHRAITIILLSLLGVSNLVFAEEQKFPPRFQAVMDYLMNDEYPELFGDKPYVIQPTGFDIGDLDGDGVDEVVVSFFPHYRQSLTIMIFKVDNKMKVTRITEGLAPGKLVPITGEYLDSHTTGHGIDMTINEEMNDPKKRDDFVKAVMKNMGNVVVYKNFIHSDGREGNGTYIDMMHIENPPKDETCESFEFPRVEQVQIGSKKDDPTPVIMALAGDEVYFYKIKAIRPDGLLDKTIDVVPMDE